MKKFLVFTRFLFLFLAFFSFYLLIDSRAGEVHTVWEFMNPFFKPVFFATTLLLVVIIFSSERVRFKLVFVSLYSFIGRSFSVAVFPAGSVSGQETVLGVTRLIYENVVFHGWGGSAENVFQRVFNWLNKPNFQNAYSVMFARMFGVDVFWVHLLLVPVLWGIFVPLLAFLIARTLGLDEKIAVLSSLLASAFPPLVYWGTISVPNSLGYVFFLSSLYFFLRYLSSDESEILYLMSIFTFASFLSHFLTGIMSFALLLVAVSLKIYEKEKIRSPLTAKFLLSISFIFSASLIPLALIYLRVFSPSYAHFSLDKIQDLSSSDFIELFLFGEYVNYSPMTALIHITGPLIGLSGLLYILYVSRKHNFSSNSRILVLFLSLGFLLAFVDYRVLKFFMMNVPFNEERIWVFRDFIMLPLSAFAICAVVQFVSKQVSSVTRLTAKALAYILLVGWISVLVGGWVVASVYSVYPRHGPLQITSYELEAVKYLESTTNESYVVIGDQWIDFAGGMIVGIHNPRGFYFAYTDARGIELFSEMKMNPSADVMIKAMNYTEATVAYFVVGEPRLGSEVFNRVVSDALKNGLEVYAAFGEGKLYVFRYEKNPP